MVTFWKPLPCSRVWFLVATMPPPVALNTATLISAGARCGSVVVGAGAVVGVVTGALEVATRPPSTWYPFTRRIVPIASAATTRAAPIRVSRRTAGSEFAELMLRNRAVR